MKTCPDCGRTFDSEGVYDAHRATVKRLGYDPDSDSDTFDGASPEARRHRAATRRRGKDEDRRFSDTYRAGIKDERARAKTKRAKKTKARRPAGRRRSSSTARELKKGARQLAPAARAQISSGMQFIGLSLAVAALYLVLTAEEQTGAFSKALGGLQGILRWLSDPGAAIPFGHDDNG